LRAGAFRFFLAGISFDFIAPESCAAPDAAAACALEARLPRLFSFPGWRFSLTSFSLAGLSDSMRGISCLLMLSLASCWLSTARRADWDSLAAKAADPAEAPKPKEATASVCRFDPPDSVLEGRRSGLVGVEYDVGVGGEALNVEPLPGFPGPGAPLFDEVTAGLKQCRFPKAPLGLHAEQVLGFNPPATVPILSPRLVEGHALVAAKGTLPSAASCEPTTPPLASDALRSYVVASNGVASQPVFAYPESNKPADKTVPPEDADRLQEWRERREKVARAWLSNCRFTPGRDASGEAVSVRFEVAPSPPPFSDMPTKPEPVHCETLRPVLPEAAKREGIAGMVLVGFIVDAAGHSSIPELLNPKAPHILYRAVRKWLTSCTYEPARDKNGTAVPVRMAQPFNFIGEP
jgi:hypothetical protein